MPIGIGTAAAITAGVGAAGAIGSAVIGANAADDAKDAQVAAAQSAERTKREMFDKARGYLEPYSTLGTEVMPTIKSLLGIGGDPSDMTATLEAYPGYKFAVDQGQKAIANQQQGQGARYSGNALKAAADYSQNMGYNVFSDYFGKLMGLQDTGFRASGAIANLTSGTGTDIANLQVGAGNAQAAGIMGRANAIAGGISGVTNAISGGIGGMTGDFTKGFSGFGTGGTGGWGGTAEDILRAA